MTKDNRKSYKKGDVLLEEEPFVFALSNKFNSERCDHCFASNQLMRCAGCSFVHYCDRDCQKKGWSYHKFECPNIKKVSPHIVPDAAKLLARLIIKLHQGGANEKSYYTDRKFRVFRDLMSLHKVLTSTSMSNQVENVRDKRHIISVNQQNLKLLLLVLFKNLNYNEIKKDELRSEHITCLEEVLKDYLGDRILPNSAELLAIYGKMVINTFSILDPEMRNIGSGLYLAASIIDHSCLPNAVAVFEGKKLYIRTLVDLPYLDWSKVYISYIDLLNLPEVRQKTLETTYYFQCQCERCLDIEEFNLMTSTICQNEDCKMCILGGLRDETTKCPECGLAISHETKDKFNEIAQFTDEKLEQMKNTAYLDVCRICLNKQEKYFHPMNIYTVRTLDQAWESCINLENWESALDYGQQLTEPLRKYLGELDPLRGVFLLKIAKIALCIGRDKEAKIYAEEAAKILLITHGPRHSLLKNDLLPILNEIRMI